MEEMYVTTYAMSSFNNGDDDSSQQSPKKPSSPVPPVGLGPLTDLFGEGGLWPPQTSAGACWWWGWRSHRPGAPQGFGSSSCQTHPHALLQPPCLHWDKNSRQSWHQDKCTITEITVKLEWHLNITVNMYFLIFMIICCGYVGKSYQI